MCKYNSDKGCLHGSASTSCTVMLHSAITLVIHTQGELLALGAGRGRHLSCLIQNMRLAELVSEISVLFSIPLFLQEASLNIQGELSIISRVFLLY